MSRGFGTTYGTGSTDKCTSSLTGDFTNMTLHAWVYPRVDGAGATFPNVFCQGASLMTVFDNHNNVANTWVFRRNFSGGNSQFTFASPAAAAWASFTIVYTNSAASNYPTIYLNGSKLTNGAGITGSLASGTTTSQAGNALLIGNRFDDVRVWDGMIAEVAVWDGLLDDGEAGALAAGYCPGLIRPSALAEYLPLIRSSVSKKRAAPTITGAIAQPHPRIIGLV
jgi:hypothetical protein